MHTLPHQLAAQFMQGLMAFAPSDGSLIAAVIAGEDVGPGSSGFATIYALGLFYSYVKTGGAWDLKESIREWEGFSGRDQWDQLIGDWKYSHETWANVLYGYMGSQIGFASDDLLDYAGLAQKKDHDTAPGLSDYVSPRGMRKYDEPADQAGVNIGISLWNKYGLAVRPEHLFDSLAANRYHLKNKPAMPGAYGGGGSRNVPE